MKTFRQSLQDDGFVVTAERSPDDGGDVRNFLNRAKTSLRHRGVTRADLIAIGAAGARLLQLEPCFDADILRQFRSRTADSTKSVCIASFFKSAAMGLSGPCFRAV